MANLQEKTHPVLKLPSLSARALARAQLFGGGAGQSGAELATGAGAVADRRQRRALAKLGAGCVTLPQAGDISTS